MLFLGFIRFWVLGRVKVEKGEYEEKKERREGEREEEVERNGRLGWRVRE